MQEDFESRSVVINDSKAHVHKFVITTTLNDEYETQCVVPGCEVQATIEIKINYK